MEPHHRARQWEGTRSIVTPPPQTAPPPRLSYRARVIIMVYLIAEAAAFFGVVQAIGGGYAVLLLLATSVLGGVLMRTIGVKALREYREAVSAGEPPGPKAVSGTIGVVGGVLLFLPGFLSDVVGLLCVLPPTRFMLRPLVIRFLESRVDSPSFARWFGPRVVRPHWGGPKPASAPPDSDEIIEGEVVDSDEPPHRTDGRSGHENGPNAS